MGKIVRVQREAAYFSRELTRAQFATCTTKYGRVTTRGLDFLSRNDHAVPPRTKRSSVRCRQFSLKLTSEPFIRYGQTFGGTLGGKSTALRRINLRTHWQVAG